MNKKQKKRVHRIAAGTLLLILVNLLPLQGTLRILGYLLPYAVIGGDVLLDAAKGLLHRQLLDENFLMALATIGAFFTGEYAEAVAVMLFYQIGELLQEHAVGKSRKSIAALMDIRPDYANLDHNGTLRQVDPEEVQVGDSIVIKPGERVPLDGIVTSGSSALDTAALTGEPLPRDVQAGEPVISGCINLSGVLHVQVSKVYTDSTVAKILELVENASEKKAKAENFITKFARYYTPLVVLAAALLTLLPTLLLLLPSTALPAFLAQTVWTDWLHRSLIFLVVSCPCALVISIPLTFFGGIGGAAKCGILVKGAAYLERLAGAKTVVFDKTGTLTQGTFSVTEVYAEAVFSDTLLAYAALAESFSDHPIAVSLRRAWAQEIDHARVAEVTERAGEGICAQVDGHAVCVGNRKLMEHIGCAMPSIAQNGTMVHVAVDGVYAGNLIIADTVKPDAAAAVASLKSAGIHRTVMLTGDSQAVATEIAAQLGLDSVQAELLPADKVTAVEALLTQHHGHLVFVGDGINDAPVLSRADVGIAMGALGSDAAIEAADVVLMDDSPSKIALAIAISRKTLRITKQNIVFALGIKALVLLMGAFGMANLWEAVFADVGVCMIAIVNAARTLRIDS